MNNESFRELVALCCVILTAVAAAEELRKQKQARELRVINSVYQFMAESEMRAAQKARNWWKFWQWGKP